MATSSYHFFFRDTAGRSVELPIPPSEVEMKVNGQNDTVTLINGGEANILKPLGLTTISFEFYIPQVQYPFALPLQKPEVYIDVFRYNMSECKPVHFTLARNKPNGEPLVSVDLDMSVENFTIKDNSDDGFDLLCEVELKEWVQYGTIVANINQTKPGTGDKTTNGGVGDAIDAIKDDRPTKDSPTNYLVKKNDTLSLIATKVYGNGKQANYKKIYEANKSTIEKVAKAHGKISSSNGKFIYPGTLLTIPKIK